MSQSVQVVGSGKQAEERCLERAKLATGGASSGSRKTGSPCNPKFPNFRISHNNSALFKSKRWFLLRNNACFVRENLGEHDSTYSDHSNILFSICSPQPWELPQSRRTWASLHICNCKSKAKYGVFLPLSDLSLDDPVKSCWVWNQGFQLRPSTPCWSVPNQAKHLRWQTHL